ncbi:MAG TPA: metal ABC transporter substrate-binding protein, partial [Microbacterium sp.]|nr:metal ABC transporter substrate-binding protein [Microbacterium sp.]
MPKYSRGVVVAAMSAVGALCLAGCSSAPDPQSAAADRPQVLTTFTVLADIAQNVAGDDIEVTSITKPGAEIHGYEPTPGDIRAASDADLVIDNGLNLEAWFAQFVETVDVTHVVVSDGVEPIDIADDAYAGTPNPHAWMSPANVQIYVDNIAEAFADLVPAAADAFAARAADYKAQLQQIQDDLDARLSELDADHRALVTCEGAFSYLARDAGLTEQYLWAV